MEKPVKIIMIDDNTDFLFTMETFLKRNGYAVLTAEDGKRGLDLIRQERPDLILLDIMMETLFSGFEVCKAVRTDPDLKEIPIIGISGMGDELSVGFDQWPDYQYFSPEAFFDKPVDKKNLLTKIQEVIQKAEARKARPKWRKDLDDRWQKDLS